MADKKLLEIAEEAIVHVHDEHKVVFGRMVTGEKFIEEHNREIVNSKFSPLTVDMETASVAHVCYVNQVPFIAVRTISDTPDYSGIAVFEENSVRASQISADFVNAMLHIMSKK